MIGLGVSESVRFARRLEACRSLLAPPRRLYGFHIPVRTSIIHPCKPNRIARSVRMLSCSAPDLHGRKGTGSIRTTRSGVSPSQIPPVQQCPSDTTTDTRRPGTATRTKGRTQHPGPDMAARTDLTAAIATHTRRPDTGAGIELTVTIADALENRFHPVPARRRSAHSSRFHMKHHCSPTGGYASIIQTSTSRV
jgi:hypothetical protein